jgi:cysteine peptidase C11 family protein
MNTGNATRQPRPRWALLSYMVSDALQLPAAHADIVEMQRVGSTDDVKIALQVQLKAGDKFKRFTVGPRNPSLRGAPESDLAVLRPEAAAKSNQVGSAQTLKEFLQWAKDNIDAEHYLLVLWGHSFGFGFGRFDANPSLSGTATKEIFESVLDVPDLRRLMAAPTKRPASKAGKTKEPHDNLLDIADIGVALDEFRQSRGGKALEILGHNTCNTSKAEIALALEGKAHFLVASQLAIPLFTGWPFKDVLETLVSKPSIEPRDLSKAIVDAFVKSYIPKTVALSALDLSHSSVIRHDVTTLADALIDAMDDPTDGLRNQAVIAMGFINARRETAALMPKEASEPAVDFYGLCREILNAIDNVPAAARGTTLKHVAGVARDVISHRDQFVVKNDGTGSHIDNLRGFLVLAPGLDPHDDVGPELQDWIGWPYGWTDTRWPNVIETVSKVTRTLGAGTGTGAVHV